MPTEYVFDLDPDRDLLKVAFRGFWSPETVDEYVLARTGAIRAMALRGVPASRLLMLIDGRDFGVQSQEASLRFKELVASSPLQPARSAFLLSSALFKMQINRIAMPNQRVFGDYSEACDWLFQKISRAS